MRKRVVDRYLHKVATSLPRRLFHGTSTRFDDFDLNKAGARDFGDFGVGIYLTPSSRLAAQYAYDSAKKTKGEPIVLVVTVKSHNPADFDDKDLQQQIALALDIPFPDKHITSGHLQTRPRAESQAITDYVRSLGYDSGIARGGKEIVVYNPRDLYISRQVPAGEASSLI